MRGRGFLVVAGLAAAAACGSGSTPAQGAKPTSPSSTDPGSGPGPGGPHAGGDPGQPPATPGPFTISVAFTDAGHRLLAVDRAGTAYGVGLDDAASLLASDDGRTWSFRGTHPARAGFQVMAALSTGTLLADTTQSSGHVLARSGDGGRTWTDVLPLLAYRMLTPHSVAELRGEVFLLEYQSFTGSDVPITLFASGDDGRTWAARAVFTDHRHGHGLMADPASGALWLLFGDRTGGTYLSLDAGATATLVRGAMDGGVLVDAVPTGDGLLGGMDTLYQPLWPYVVAMSRSASYAQAAALPGPSYSIHRLSGGGYLVGAAREPGGDVYAAGDVSAHLLASSDGETFEDVLAWPRASDLSTARADVYWELATGEPVVELRNCAGFGAGGAGYVLLTVTR